MALNNPPMWLQNAGATHAAYEMRTAMGGFMGVASGAGSLVPAGGVNPVLGNKFQVTQTGSPSMGVLVRSGVAWVPGTQSGTQGTYACFNDADVTLTITTADATNPRIDIVVLTIRDTQYSGANDDSILQVIAGTPGSSPAAPATPANSLKMANVAVGAGVTSISNANITDQRTWLAGLSGYKMPDVQNIIASGNWTKPDASRFVVVEIWGGGGAGGGAATTAAGEASTGGGGQAGGYAARTFDAASLNATEVVVIGAGGTGGTGAGANGVASTFSTAGNQVKGDLGNGGPSLAASASFGFSAQPTVTQTNVGTITVRGNPGTYGTRAGPSAGAGGIGGASSLGGAGAHGSNITGGAAEANSGSGGGGAGNNPSQSARNGGNGGAGRCIVTTYF